VTLVYSAVGLLVAAQLLGIYALVTRKADLVFSIVVILLLGVALGLVADFAFSHFHIHLFRHL
jgi:hypothetical protein